MVSVVSCAGSGSHRSEIRVEKRQDGPACTSRLVMMNARDARHARPIDGSSFPLGLARSRFTIAEAGGLKHPTVNSLNRYSRPAARITCH